MDFLFYLTPEAHQILNLVISKSYKIQENAPTCKKYTELFGYIENKKFIICTSNIKSKTNLVEYYVNETVYHESVHIAQFCKGSSLGIKNPTLSAEKLNDVVRSTNYNKDAFTYEVEAYYLEDKPEQIGSYIKKYCF